MATYSDMAASLREVGYRLTPQRIMWERTLLQARGIILQLLSAPQSQDSEVGAGQAQRAQSVRAGSSPQDSLEGRLPC